MCKEHRLFCAEASFWLFDFVFLFQFFFLLVIVVCCVLFLRLGLYVALLTWNSLCSRLPPECRIKGVGLPAGPDGASVAHWLEHVDIGVLVFCWSTNSQLTKLVGISSPTYLVGMLLEYEGC